MALLSPAFYLDNNVVAVAQNLLGKVLFTHIDGITTGGMITETEAYCGTNDNACHANNGKRTVRNEVMYQQGGLAYVYLCYGIHHLFNVVTNIAGQADAVLIRSIEPVEGLATMMKRRNKTESKPNLSSGPGALSQALGITTLLYGQNLRGSVVWIEDVGHNIPLHEMVQTTRIGVGYAGADALNPWRFYHGPSKWVSKK
jgi:DNA-3-methyladenine glycosylase